MEMLGTGCTPYVLRATLRLLLQGDAYDVLSSGGCRTVHTLGIAVVKRQLVMMTE